MLPQQTDQNEEKSLARKLAERKIREVANKGKKKLAKKAAKLALKLLKKAAMKFISLLGQLLAWLAGTIGLPAIGIGILVIVCSIVISLSWSYLVGTGEGLQGEDKALHDYIVEQADSTVNMSSALERPYRVPETLIAATVQLDAFQNNDVKGIIKKMANSLAPTFDYGQYDEWKEKQVTVCEDGNCKEGAVEHTQNLVSKLDNVDYWNGSTTFTYTPKVTPWETKEEISYREEKYTEHVPESYVEIVTETYIVYEKQASNETIQIPYTVTTYVKAIDESGKIHLIPVTETKYREETKLVYHVVPVEKTREVEVKRMRMVEVEKTRSIEVKTITKTRKQYYESTQTTSTDYATFDNVLNSYGLSLNDKSLIEANYMFMGGDIAYTDWLKTMGGGDLGFISFDGNIIPGGGVPPQFMPYYLSAEKRFGVNWYVLAAIHFVETGFSSHPTMISSVGAIGPMQFMPATWVGWKYNIGGGLVASSTDLSSLAVIAAGNGYGTDGDNDGKADPWNVADSIHTAANYLSKNGYSSDPRSAIFQYNHAEWYVTKVLTNAERFKNAATYEGGGETPPLQPGSFMRPTMGTITSPFGYRDFRGGAMHYGIDIANSAPNVPIVASADGVVIRSNKTASYGNCVMIQHNIGGQVYVTVYAHMQNRAVEVGSNVKQGQFLGYMGQTGDATGVHLHFEMHTGTWISNTVNAINPALMIQF